MVGKSEAEQVDILRNRIEELTLDVEKYSTQCEKVEADFREKTSNLYELEGRLETANRRLMDLGEDPIDPQLRSPSSGHELTLEPDGSKTPKEPQSSGGSGPRPGSIPPPPPDEKKKKDVLPKEVLECMSAFVTIKDAAVNISEKMTGASNATNKLSLIHI